MKRKFLTGFLLICTVLFLSTPVMAAQFTNVVTFGDSISDNGTDSDPYGFGIYTDGTPWADQLANKLGANMFNVAYGGATTGLGNVYAPPVGTVPVDTTGLNWQVNFAPIQAQIAPMAKDSTLFTVMAGANDYNRLMALTGYAATTAQKVAAGTTAAQNVGVALNTLAADLGAKHIMVGYGMFGDDDFGIEYLTQLSIELATFALFNPDIEIYGLDLITLFEELLTKYTEAELLWVDGYHPGPIAHAAMADAAYDLVAPVPEPGTMILLFSGLIGIAGISRRKAA